MGNINQSLCQIPKNDKKDKILNVFNSSKNISASDFNKILHMNEFLIYNFIEAIKILDLTSLSNDDLKKLQVKVQKVYYKNMESINVAKHTNLSLIIFTTFLMIIAFLLLLCTKLFWPPLPFLFGGALGCLSLWKMRVETKERLKNESLLSRTTNQIADILDSDNLAENNNRKYSNSKQIKLPYKEFIKAQVKAIGDEDLHDIINRIRSTILLLPNDEEGIYLARLEAAQSTYNRHMDELETRDKDSEITLLLGDKLSYLEQFKTELSKIEQEINLKNLFVSSENFNSELARSINEFLENIQNFQDKDIALLELMNPLANIIKPDDLTQTLNIAEYFATCFWETIFLCNENEQENILAHLNPTFISAIVLKGEQKLDDMEQTLEVISIRQTLYQMKNSNDLNIETYLRALIKYIESLEKKSPGRFRKK